MPKNEIKKLKKEIERLKSLAYKDELTNLYNRRGFQEKARKFINEVIGHKKFPTRRKSSSFTNFSLIVFDIDNFKKLNDTYGHQTGDYTLKLIAQLLLEKVRAIDIIARWGGEEIILGLVGANEDDAFKIADDIRQKVAQTKFKWRGKTINFTISGGVASFEKAKDFDDLFQKADKALYLAKRKGKNMIVGN